MSRTQHGKVRLWLLWGALSMAAVAYFAAGMLSDSAATNPLLKPARQMLLPGATTNAHYQIEMACTTCHRNPFGGKESLQEACVDCHGAALKAADDSHPTTKFLDPRNAELMTKLDATLCVACHIEHRPEITSAMALTVPVDVCAHCHTDIAEDRPSHAGMEFSTCASAGCHNFHDNSALYEDFLLRHLHDAAIAAKPVLPERDFAQMAAMLPDYPSDRYPVEPLDRAEADAAELWSAGRWALGTGQSKSRVDESPASGFETATDDWLASSHAAAGVNCSACHGAAEDASSTWNPRPDHQTCASCHAPEVEGFTSGKHGMRLAQGLPPMTPAQARLPMRADAQDKSLTCTSCHGAHSFDSKSAAVEACLGCHEDRHSLAYRDSPHHRLWLAEHNGQAPAGSGVSCASCHLPRIEHRDAQFDIKRVLVQHNQSDTLRPNERLLRPVCLSCHGLQFALDALSDRALIDKNFAGQPTTKVRSLQLADERLKQHEAQRRAADALTSELEAEEDDEPRD